MEGKAYRRKNSPRTEDISYETKLKLALDEVTSFEQIASAFSQLPCGSPLEKIVLSKLEEMARFDTIEDAALVFSYSLKDSPLEEKAYQEMVKLADLPSVKTYDEALKICELAPLHTELRKDACSLMFRYAKTYDEYYNLYIKLSEHSELKGEIFATLLEMKPNLTKSLIGSLHE